MGEPRGFREMKGNIGGSGEGPKKEKMVGGGERGPNQGRKSGKEDE